jgi:glycosyltransferase involved in cell wall biosynthesis
LFNRVTRHTAMKSVPIIFLSADDPRESKNWSGTFYSIFQALKDDPAGAEVNFITGGALNFAARALNKVLRYAHINIDCRFSTLFARLVGAYLTVRLAFMREAVIVAVAASNFIPDVKTRKKIIYISDATFQIISNLYPDFIAFPNWLKKQGNRNEAKTLRKSSYVIYPSNWAARSAERDYGIPSERIFQLPFGPNISDAVINDYYRPKSSPLNEVRIVFVSADWKRKNGDAAVEVCRLLINAGIKVRLITIGKTPEEVRKIDFVSDRGFLHKSNPTQLKELCQEYREAHFLLLPTVADASPIVFSEAQAFGVAPVTYDVGGIGSSIINGETGLLLPMGATTQQFAAAIMAYVKDGNLYTKLSESCRKWHLDRANWSKWSQLIIQLAHAAMENRETKDAT